MSGWIIWLMSADTTELNRTKAYAKKHETEAEDVIRIKENILLFCILVCLSLKLDYRH